VETVAELDGRLAAGATALDGWTVSALDLRDHARQLTSVDVAGSLFLGCRYPAGLEDDLRARGALIFPAIPDVPVDAYRARLYSPSELYDGLPEGYGDTLDARVYAWAKAPPSRESALTQALHDYAVGDALDDWAVDRSLVGVMGGHALRRGDGDYAAAAHLARTLQRSGLTVCTGGGPGAMEAANLGAYFARYPDDDLAEALGLLAAAPSFTPSVTAWAEAAFEVLGRWPDGGASLGIPTWHYGHEPPNPFATAIAKHFTNAIREDILLHLCAAGIVFLPGAGGTVQEIFQDACENYYADPAAVAPMVLVGRDHWTRDLPAWPLLERLATDRPMARAVHLVDDLGDPSTVVSLLTRR
jgi:predicted Rossmann-fold nucleotide-binding protein